MENEESKGETGRGPEGSLSVQGGSVRRPDKCPEQTLSVACLSYVDSALKHNTL